MKKPSFRKGTLPYLLRIMGATEATPFLGLRTTVRAKRKCSFLGRRIVRRVTRISTKGNPTNLALNTDLPKANAAYKPTIAA